MHGCTSVVDYYMPDTRSVDRVDTGVPGLDTILNGGLFRGGVYIVEGAPGSGKTILGNQILARIAPVPEGPR